MLVSKLRAGERRTVDVRDNATKQRTTVAFTILRIDWFPSLTRFGCGFRGAEVLTDSGIKTILDPMTLEFSQPASLPAQACGEVG